MKLSTKILNAGIILLLLSACASPPQNINKLRMLTQQASTGSDGQCLTALYETGLAISQANAALSVIDSGEELCEEQYEMSMAAAQRAVASRKKVDQYCNLRYQALQADMKSIQSDLQEIYESIESLPGVTFMRDSSALTDDAKPILDAIASRLVREKRRIEIAGHTSNTGSFEHNLKLSKERAQSVVDYLISKGVPANRIVARGYGMTQPVTSNKTQEGRNANKRVEVRYRR